ncbi:PREDICTED: uncharacterized protein LOC109234386 [Nicotiana attenuata]|uniref:Endoplasmic reticulum transmembrane protein n=1 Tax=Nicotiana attenuata TaxID=49451 RepID=A0A1J6HW48_NICAT|nr:PREDICTED: uncharacterized protein LOC109234386 [Nicotiana attenuata]OIS97061.1 hypothetical protein A4A49_39120 [Nicotiana attenuata]
MLAQVQLLFMVVFLEMSLILLFLFKTPLRKLIIMTLDRVKRGRGPLIVKSVAATVLVIMIYTVYSIRELQSRPTDAVNPTDQILLAHQILQAALMGFCLFLGLMVDRLHHYIRELRLLRKTMEAVKKQDRASDNGKNGEASNLKDEISSLRNKVMQLESENEAKEKEVNSQKANSDSLKGQSEKLLLKYDRLVEENQNLRSQLQSVDQNVSHSDSKKNT